MAFMCPDCKSNALQIAHSLELPPDAYDDEITLQVVRCAQCGFHALAVYRESRHGALDSESWRHEGYRVSEEDFQLIRHAVRRCPSPSTGDCQCATHQMLGQMNGYSWDGLQKSGVKIQGIFNLQSGMP